MTNSIIEKLNRLNCGFNFGIAALAFTGGIFKTAEIIEHLVDNQEFAPSPEEMLLLKQSAELFLDFSAHYIQSQVNAQSSTFKLLSASLLNVARMTQIYVSEGFRSQIPQSLTKIDFTLVHSINTLINLSILADRFWRVVDGTHKQY